MKIGDKKDYSLLVRASARSIQAGSNLHKLIIEYQLTNKEQLDLNNLLKEENAIIRIRL